MRTQLEIRWWIFEQIENRAGKYNWNLACLAGEETTYSYKTMFVYGEIVAETEKAFKVSLDYTKGFNRESGILNGFMAWVPKKAIVSRQEIADGMTAEDAEEITAADLRTYCSCGIE